MSNERDVNLIIIGDTNNEASRALATALQNDPSLNVPYHLLDIRESKELARFLRATPAVGVLYICSDLQEAVERANAAKVAAYLGAEGEVTKAVAYAPDEEILSLPADLYDKWAPDTEYKTPLVLDHEGQLYMVMRDHVSLAHQPPGSDGMLAVYRPIHKGAAGTIDDPIPYVYGMDCYEGKYYSYLEKLYLCKADMTPCTWPPDTSGLWQWEEVVL